MAQAPFKLDMTIYQGATFDKTNTWKTGPSGSEVAVDLTGCTARMQIREKVDSEDFLLELTTENGRLELGDAAGTVRRLIDADDTADITWRKGVYDLEIEFADGTVRRLLTGSVSVSPEVTREP